MTTKKKPAQGKATKKPRNRQDLTLRNLRAIATRLRALDEQMRTLDRAVGIIDLRLRAIESPHIGRPLAGYAPSPRRRL